MYFIEQIYERRAEEHVPVVVAEAEEAESEHSSVMGVVKKGNNTRCASHKEFELF